MLIIMVSIIIIVVGLFLNVVSMLMILVTLLIIVVTLLIILVTLLIRVVTLLIIVVTPLIIVVTLLIIGVSLTHSLTVGGACVMQCRMLYASGVHVSWNAIVCAVGWLVGSWLREGAFAVGFVLTSRVDSKWAR
jgi:hypothetical protein